MAGRKVALILALVSAGTVWLTASLRAAPYDEAYNFGAAYIPAFINRSNGPDMLPLTADDFAVALNLGGSLSFDVLDVDGATGGFNIHFGFHNRKFDDDEQLSLTKHSEFNLGIIAEGENWCDMRQDDGLGATGAGADGSQVAWSGRNWDWETNDSTNGNNQPGCPRYTGWEDGSDYMWYNNAEANQRGLGGSRYYFEYKRPELFPGVAIFDEPEKYRRANRMKHTWAANPGNGNRDNTFASNLNIEIRGYLIPVSAIHSLPHGSLHPLFGWQTVDMADYVREVIGAYIDPNGYPVNGLEVWDNEEGGYNGNCGVDCAPNNGPPYKYLYIFQTSDSVTPSCSDGNVPAAMAYYGMTADVSRSRRCHIVFKGDSAHTGGVRNEPIDITPPTPTGGWPQLTNGWGRDDMIRADYANFGNLQTGSGVGWQLTDDALTTGPDTRVVRLPAGAEADQAWAKLPTMNLPARYLGTVQGKVRLRLETGTTALNQVQIALVHGTDAVASGGFRVGRPATVGIGGTIVGGPVSGATGAPELPTPDANGDQKVNQTDLDAFIDCITGPTIQTVSAGCIDFDLDIDADIDQVDYGIFQGCWSGPVNNFDPGCANVGVKISPGDDYLELGLWYDASTGTVKLSKDGEKIAEYSAGSPTGATVDGLYVWTSGGENLYVDLMGVYSGAFTCGGADFDLDGDVDEADAAAKQACYSGSGKPYRTGIFPSCACADTDGDYDVDEADGVSPP
ncbi:MAG: hypothetical protein AMXMBFR83_30120 [Phycisphaerae bacterium]